MSSSRLYTASCVNPQPLPRLSAVSTGRLFLFASRVSGEVWGKEYHVQQLLVVPLGGLGSVPAAQTQQRHADLPSC